MNKTCKDCIHYDVCLPNSQAYGVKLKVCSKFKGKDRFIELPYEGCCIKQIMYLKYVKKLSWEAVALKMGYISPDACRMAVKRCLERALKGEVK